MIRTRGNGHDMLVPVEVVLEVGDAIQNGSPVGAADVAMLQGTDLQAPALGALIYCLA